MDITNSVDVQSAIADIWGASKLLAEGVHFNVYIHNKYHGIEVQFNDCRQDTCVYHYYRYNVDLSPRMNAECLNEFIHNKGLV